MDRAGKPWQWAPTFLLGRELRGATLGIIAWAASAGPSHAAAAASA